MRSFLVTILTWAALFALLWGVTYQRYTPPGDWIGAVIVSFFVAIGIGALRKGHMERQDAALVARAEDAPQDEKRIALAGTVEAAAELLHAPFSGAPCLIYDYSISHTQSSSRSGGSSSVIADRSGFALAPTFIRAGVRSIRLLAWPGMEDFPKTSVDEELRASALRYVTETQFDDRSSLLALPDLARIMSETSGSIRRDWKLSSYDGLDTIEERFVRPGERVCVIGRYSAKDNAIVPEANAGGVRIVRGTRQEVFDSLRASRLADIVMAVFLVLVPTLAVWGILAYRENWFDKQKKEAVRTGAREAFVKATAIGDLAAVAEALRGGVDANARDENGDPALANAPDAATAEALIAGGANVNAAGHDELTTLMLAVTAKRPAVVRVLIRHGANVNVYNRAYEATALMLALQNGDKETAKIIRDAGGRKGQTH